MMSEPNRSFHGLRRSAYLVGPIVLKLPWLDFLGICSFALSHLREIHDIRRVAGFIVRLTCARLKAGVKENFIEFWTWIRFRSSVLQPVHFWLGIVLVQKRGMPTRLPDEIEKEWLELLWAASGDKAGKYHQNHHLRPIEFLREGRGYRLMDYGDWSVGELLALHRAEAERILG